MAAGLTMPTQQFLLCLADPWTTFDGTDISLFVKEWNGTVAGRQHELQEFQAGTLDLILWNQDGRFSPWNTNSPYYNLLSAADASQDGASLGTWVSLQNCTLSPLQPPIYLNGYGSYSIGVACTGGSTAKLGTAHNVYAVTVGQQYTAMASFLALTDVYTCNVAISWYTSGGSLISTSSGSTVSSSTSAWTKATVTATAPATAAYAEVIAVLSGSTSDTQYVNRAALFRQSANSPNTAWAPGQRGLVPARAITCTATWSSTPYDIWSMFVDSWIPKYGQTKSEMTIKVSDGLNFLALEQFGTTMYLNLVTRDGAVDLWILNEPVGTATPTDFLNQQSPSDVAGTEPTFGGTAALLITGDTTCAFSSSISSPLSIFECPLSQTYFDWNGSSSGAYSIEFWFMMTSFPIAPPLENQGEYILTVNNPTCFSGAYWGNYVLGSSDHYVSMGGYPVYFFVNGSQSPNPGALSVTIQQTTEANSKSIESTANYCDGNWHHIVGIFNYGASSGLDQYLYIDGELIGSVTSTLGTFGLSAGSQVRFGAANFAAQLGAASQPDVNVADVAAYPIALTATQISNHHYVGSTGFDATVSGTLISQMLTAVGIPTAYQSIETGNTTIAPYGSPLDGTAVLSSIQDILTSENGAFFYSPSGQYTFYERQYKITNTDSITSQATLSNVDPTDTYYHYLPKVIPTQDDLDLWNDVPVASSYTNASQLQRALDLTSANQYGLRTLQGYTSLLFYYVTDSLGMAQWLLSLYHLPVTRVREITLTSMADAGRNLPQMLGRGIFDCITVIFQPIDGSAVAFNQLSLIEMITHKVTQSSWITTWALTPQETKTYLILNSATRGYLDSGNDYAW
jgi:hypothetical protein